MPRRGERNRLTDVGPSPTVDIAMGGWRNDTDPDTTGPCLRNNIVSSWRLRISVGDISSRRRDTWRTR